MYSSQRTILFLIADTGAGHRSAANAITNALKLISQREQEAWQSRAAAGSDSSADDAQPPPTYRIEIVDVFAEYSRFPLRETMKLYGPTIRYNPKLFGQLFHKSNKEGPVKAANLLATPLIHNGLLRLFTMVQPDIIVSIHPLLNFVTVRALKDLGMRIPFLTVVTDLVSIHYWWFAPGVDGYIVPTEQARDLYLQRGLNPEKIHMLGMPIDPKFAQPVAGKKELQKKFGLQPGVATVLLVGGGDGAGGLRAAVRAISRAHLPVQLMVVTGRNRRLYVQLQKNRSKLRVPAVIFGFVHNMPELMHAADVIVTKAGPGSICEALACNLPVILSGYVPGQEEGNVEYVVSNEMGYLALDSTTLIDTLRRLLKPGSPERQRCLEQAKLLSKPMASFDIAQCIMRYVNDARWYVDWKSARWQRQRGRMSGRLQSAIRLHKRRTRFTRTAGTGTSSRRLLQASSHEIQEESQP